MCHIWSYFQWQLMQLPLDLMSSKERKEDFEIDAGDKVAL